jgi:hypothetical protein
MDIPERHSPHSENHQEHAAKSEDPAKRSQQEVDDESRLIRRLQIMMNMVMSVLSQEDMSLEEASELVANAKRAALAMFPDKELAYDLIYKPRLQRLLRERFRLQ